MESGGIPEKTSAAIGTNLSISCKVGKDGSLCVAPNIDESQQTVLRTGQPNNKIYTISSVILEIIIHDLQ